MTVSCLLMALWAKAVQPYRAQFAAMQLVAERNGVVESKLVEGAKWQRWLVTRLVHPDAFVEVQLVDLTNAQFTPGDTTRLTGLRHAWALSLDYSNFDNDDTFAIARIPTLTHLSLSRCGIDDTGLANLGAHPGLKGLVLSGCPVTDESVDTIARNFPRLAAVFLHETLLTEAGTQRLRERLPKCRVHRDAKQ